jgi:hypothetical protein
MNTLISVLALVGILSAGIIYGTDAFCALVQRPALTDLDDATMTAVMGRVHEYGDRRLPVPGVVGLLAALATTATAALNGSILGSVAAGIGLVAMLVWLGLYLGVAAPINRKLIAAALAHQVPAGVRQLQSRWDSVIAPRAVLMAIGVAALTCSAIAH